MRKVYKRVWNDLFKYRKAVGLHIKLTSNNTIFEDSVFVSRDGRKLKNHLYHHVENYNSFYEKDNSPFMTNYSATIDHLYILYKPFIRVTRLTIYNAIRENTRYIWEHKKTS
jgi:hypothetical protein